MMKERSIVGRLCMPVVAALLVTAGSAATAMAGTAHPDLLDLPAMISAQAAKRLQIAVTAAGRRLVSVGERGIVLYSDDGGKKWVQAKVPVSVTLTAVQFVNARTGFAVGHDGLVLRSDDGGQSWMRVFDGAKANAMVTKAAEERVGQARSALAAAVGADAKAAMQRALEQAEFVSEDAKSGASFGPSRPLFGLWFSSATAGYVVGSYGQIFRTVDGGRQWQYLGAQMDNPDGLHLNAVVGNAAGTLLVAAESGKVFRSDDGGASWRMFTTGYDGPLYGVLDLDGPNGDAKVLMAFGFSGRIFRSSDGGASWTAVDPGVKRATLVAAQRLPSGAIWLLSQDGTLWRSTDDGRTVQAAGRAPVTRVAGFVAAPAGDSAVLVGVGGITVVALVPTAEPVVVKSSKVKTHD